MKVEQYLEPQPDPDFQRELFSKGVVFVELEVHSYCNRKCWFCPNSFIDRQSQVRTLDELVYLQILRDLAEINYEAGIGFSGYSEPFSQLIFFKRLNQASEILPSANLHANTNGDYLNEDTLRMADDAGLCCLYVQLYFDRGEEYTQKAIEEKMHELQRRIPFVKFHEAGNCWFGLYGHIVLKVYASNFRKMGQNRCDLPICNNLVRIKSCLEPMKFVSVRHNSCVVPCCDIRSDYEKHKAFILGKVDSEPGSLFRIYAGAKAATWRKRLMTDKPKEYPCRKCTRDGRRTNMKQSIDGMRYCLRLRELKNG